MTYDLFHHHISCPLEFALDLLLSGKICLGTVLRFGHAEKSPNNNVSSKSRGTIYDLLK